MQTMRWLILAVIACGIFPCPAYADGTATRKLYEEMVAERKWAQSELWAIEHMKKDVTTFRAQLAQFEDSLPILDKLLPETPRAEEWRSEMEKYADSCGTALFVDDPAEIEHDRYLELRFRIEVKGDENPVKCFRTRLRNRSRISGWTPKGRLSDGTVLAEVSIFYAPASDAAPRPCRVFDPAAVKDAGRHLKELERVIFDSTFTGLQKLCRELEASPEERRLVWRKESVMNRIKLITDLETLHEP